MVADALAVGSGLAVALICLRAGRGPIALSIIGLLHARAVGMVLRQAVRVAWFTARTRYWEYYHRARWEAGR